MFNWLVTFYYQAVSGCSMSLSYIRHAFFLFWKRSGFINNDRLESSRDTVFGEFSIEPFEVIWGLPVILYFVAVSGGSKYLWFNICYVIDRFWKRRRIIDNDHLDSNKDLFLSIGFDLYDHYCTILPGSLLLTIFFCQIERRSYRTKRKKKHIKNHIDFREK